MNRATQQLQKTFYLFKKRHPRLVMTTLIFIVIPLAAGLILGYEMSGDVPNSIPTVVVDHDRSPFSKDYLQYIDDSQFFNIVEYADMDGRIEDMMSQGKAFVGVIIPENFYNDMITGKAPKILTIYDGVTLAVVTSSKSSMTEILLTVKGAYMMNIYEGKQSVVPDAVMNQVTPIDVTYRTLFNPTKNFRNFVLPGMLVAIIQVGISIMGAERGWENQRKDLSFLYHMKTIFAWGCLGAVSISLCLGLQFLLFGMPYRGTLLGGAVLTVIFSISITGIGYIVGSFLSDRTFATQIASVLILPSSILGGYTWPILGMPDAFRIVAKFIPFSYYGEDIRGLCLKPLEFRHLLPDMSTLLLFICAELAILLLVKFIKRNSIELDESDEYDLEVGA